MPPPPLVLQCEQFMHAALCACVGADLGALDRRQALRLIKLETRADIKERNQKKAKK